MPTSEERSLLAIIVDVSPTTWGERDLKRTASDKARLAAGKRSVGPATLEDVLSTLSTFAGAYASLEQDNVLIVIAVASNECAMVYPRKNELHEFFQGSKLDIRRLREGLILGTAELVARAADKAEAELKKGSPLKTQDSSASMATALSLALCSVNRFLVTASGGVSALASSSVWKRKDDEGVLSLIGSGTKKTTRGPSAWSPRILCIQSSQDRSHDYNAIMNCVFAASKHNIVIDGCFIPSGISSDSKSSPFLEQACDYTRGVFLAPSGPAQVGGALTEVMLSVFLSPLASRSSLNLPGINKVDFRARCFDTGETVDTAFVCNQCLSIFKMKPNEFCPTCGAEIKAKRRKETA
jgi:transcription initiation factor TFIIH subunit 3